MRKRRKPAPEQADPCPRLRENFREVAAERDALIKGMDDLIATHQPYPEQEGMRLGNGGREVRFYCDRCRTPWPCRLIDDLGAIYAKATGWEPAGTPFDPLILTRKEADK